MKNNLNVKEFFKKHVKWNKLSIIPIALLVILGIFFIYHWTSLGNPDMFNPALDTGEVSGDASYLFTDRNNISITFMAIMFFYVLALLLDLTFRRESSHVAMVIIGLLIEFSYAITKLVWLCSWDGFRAGSARAFMAIALIGIIGLFYTMVKKALDGDENWVYHTVLIATIFFLYFASVNCASVLDLYVHKGDIVFWNDWGSAHCMVLLLICLGNVNLHSDYDPDPIVIEDTHVDLKNQSSKK